MPFYVFVLCQCWAARDGDGDDDDDDDGDDDDDDDDDDDYYYYYYCFSTAQKIIIDTLQKQKNYRFVQLHNYTYNDR